MTRAIEKHLRDFLAIIALFLVASAVGVFVLAHQRLHLPSWVPLVGQNTFELKAEFSTAQAVTPGQGQTVDIAGVKVGEISNVDLVNGRAVVTMRIDPKHDRIYRNATMLLRPKTGLKDMIVELNPGTSRTQRVHDGDTIPVQNTLPDVNLDEILTALDADTRDYLRLLLGAGGEGLRGQSLNLAATLRRLDPTSRDLAKITHLLARRRDNLRRVIHNFQLLATALGAKDQQLGQLVASSNAVFGHLANQDDRLREALGLLPGSLDATQSALRKADRLARALGPTLGALRPGARALAPALQATRPFLRQTTPVIRDELRPFARAARPVARALRPTTHNLAALAPALLTATRVVNFLLNELAYNPPGDRQEGFLFWLSWANHNAASVFANQDAHGAIRHGLLLASCSTLGLLQQVASTNAQLATLIALTNPPLNSDLCPKSTAP